MLAQNNMGPGRKNASETAGPPSHSTWFRRLHYNISKTQESKDLQGWQGSGELGRSRLGDVEPFLHRLGLYRAILFEQFGDIAYRQVLLFLSDDLHNTVGGKPRNPASGLMLASPSILMLAFRLSFGESR
jgi:hypothetical protein